MLLYCQGFFSLYDVKPLDPTIKQSIRTPVRSQFLTNTSVVIRAKFESPLTGTKIASNRVVTILVTFGCAFETFVYV